MVIACIVLPFLWEVPGQGVVTQLQAGILQRVQQVVTVIGCTIPIVLRYAFLEEDPAIALIVAVHGYLGLTGRSLRDAADFFRGVIAAKLGFYHGSIDIPAVRGLFAFRVG